MSFSIGIIMRDDVFFDALRGLLEADNPELYTDDDRRQDAREAFVNNNYGTLAGLTITYVYGVEDADPRTLLIHRPIGTPPPSGLEGIRHLAVSSTDEARELVRAFLAANPDLGLSEDDIRLIVRHVAL